jgi:hypothetical protein
VRHLLNGHALGLREQHGDEERHEQHPGAEEVEEAEAEVAEQREEDLPDEGREEHVDGHRDAHRRRPHGQRVDLAGDQPSHGPPRPREAGHVHAHEQHDAHGVLLRDVARPAHAELQPDERPHKDLPVPGKKNHAWKRLIHFINGGVGFYLGDDHLRAALQEERAASDLIGGGDGDEGGEDVDEAGDDGGHEGGVLLEADCLEEHRRVEHDDVDAGELLEEGDEQRERELGLVLAAEEELPPGALHGLGVLARRGQVVELLAHVADAPDLGQRLARRGRVPALDERRRGVRDGERAQRDDGGRDGAERHGDAPAPAARDLGRQVVGHVRRQDSHRDHELEQDVEHPALLRRRHLGDVERGRLDGDADAGADEDAAREQHREVHGHAADARADHVRGRGGEQGPLAPEGAGHRAGEEGGHRRGEEEGGAEQRQDLAVELAVLVDDHLPLHLLVDGGEELDQERLRRRQPGFTYDHHGGDGDSVATTTTVRRQSQSKPSSS